MHVQKRHQEHVTDDHQILLHAEATIHTEHRGVLADQSELGLRQYVLLGHIHLAMICWITKINIITMSSISLII